MHSLPGRVRLRLSREDATEGAVLVDRLASHPAVRGSRWTAAARSLTVEFDPGVSFQEILGTLPGDPEPEVGASEPPRQPLWRQFLLPAISMAAGLTGPSLVTRVVIGLCAAPIGRRAVRSLLGRRVTIDVLDVTAVGLLLGVGDTLAAGISVALIESGERIRHRASGRARRVLRNWMGADPRGVRVLRPGTEPRLPIAQVKAGDQVVVYAGESIPVDGRLSSGSGMVDNRTWTGEPVPRSISRGGMVLAGSSLVDGRIVIRVVATGEQTKAGRLAAALEDAIAANTRVYDRARRIADAFVLPTFLLAGLTYALSGQLGRAISILIIDFGTGVRIAIPTTVLTTMVAGARHGILFRNGQAVDSLARVDTVVFDKTGTLTTGRPAVVDVVPEPGADAVQALRLAASAEGHLPHPLARAVRRAARKAGLELSAPDSVRYLPGGVEAVVEGHEVWVGEPRFLERKGLERPKEETAESSVALVAIDGRLAARIRFRDSVRESARSAIRGLRELGISELLLATGDHRAAARVVARQLHLDECHAGLMPEDKVKLVEGLREQGRVVAVVGDGINDAAAMAVANVGIAVPRGADLARETADVVLLEEDLGRAVAAIRLARSANEIVRENIVLVATPNVAGLSLAMLGRLNPLTATIVNNGSTILAAANALRPLRG
ncbi:MAG: cadmium-translocating P-type ATPase [Candidatus Dormibacteraeota bacterium]|nr:cadmium-translocating P-type ATPase [Candidatus Dormibacteraeota bacterium]